MTRKCFELVAAAISAARRPDDLPGNVALDRVAENLAVRFGAENPRFKTALFLAACRA